MEEKMKMKIVIEGYFDLTIKNNDFYLLLKNFTNNETREKLLIHLQCRGREVSVVTATIRPTTKPAKGTPGDNSFYIGLYENSQYDSIDERALKDKNYNSTDSSDFVSLVFLDLFEDGKYKNLIGGEIATMEKQEMELKIDTLLKKNEKQILNNFERKGNRNGMVSRNF